MPAAGQKDATLEDVQVLGEWNFTLQPDTPLFWLKAGRLDRYLLRYTCRASSQPATLGVVFHAEADGRGTDGCSFWIERQPRARNGDCLKTYCLSGDALESRPIVTRSFPDVPGQYEEEVQIYIQGYTGCIFLNGKKVQLKFRCKRMSGSVAFYNTSKDCDVSFARVSITALHRGPMEVAGILGQREQKLLASKSATGAEERIGEAIAAERAVGLIGANGVAGDTNGKAKGTGQQTNSDMASSGNGFRSTNQENVAYSSLEEPRRATTPPGGKHQRDVNFGVSRYWRQQFRGASSKARLRQCASEGVLKRGGAVCSGTSMKQAQPRALALNPHKTEQGLLNAVSRRGVEAGSCDEFIPIEGPKPT